MIVENKPEKGFRFDVFASNKKELKRYEFAEWHSLNKLFR